MNNCPVSGSAGKRVGRVTLESLLLPEHMSRIGSGQWFFCPDPDCAVVYFGAGHATLDKSALCVRVGTKETTPPRTICYCFDHTFEQLEEDVARTGTSPIPDNITELCRQGLHDCERKNPRGICCVGNVRQVVRDAQVARSRSAASNSVGEHDCCAAAPLESQTPASSSGGRLAAGGAVVSAVMSSACCWLPLLLLAFGASAAGVSAFFERYRPAFLSTAAVLLAIGFYLVYFREPACAPGDTCDAPNARLTKINKAMLWVAAVFVATFALFPNYVGVLLGTTQAGNAAFADMPHDLEFAVEGMTCEACAVTLQSELAGLPGVSAALVLYSARRARLRFESPNTAPAAGAIAQIVADAGYEAVLPEVRLP